LHLTRELFMPKTIRSGFFPLLILAALGTWGCSSDSTDDSGTQQPTTGSGNPSGGVCKANTDCAGRQCLTDETFTVLAGKPAEIKGGYCSLFNCPRGEAEGICGKGGYCADLQQYLESSFSACMKTCTQNSDCRESDNQVCSDGSGNGFVPFPNNVKVCLPVGLLCLLEIPHPSCPPTDGGVKEGGASEGGADAQPEASTGSDASLAAD
jgi:hypothetical protein